MSQFTKGGGFFLCLCFGGETGCLESTVEGLCVLLQKSGELPHLCEKEHICVCVCVFFSAELPDGCYLGESHGRASWQGTPIVWSAILSRKFDPPRENLSCCSTFPIPAWWGWGEGCLFLFAADTTIHTWVWPTSKTKKFVWPCCEFFFLPISLPALGQKKAKQS